MEPFHWRHFDVLMVSFFKTKTNERTRKHNQQHTSSTKNLAGSWHGNNNIYRTFNNNASQQNINIKMLNLVRTNTVLSTLKRSKDIIGVSSRRHCSGKAEAAGSRKVPSGVLYMGGMAIIAASSALAYQLILPVYHFDPKIHPGHGETQV